MLNKNSYRVLQVLPSLESGGVEKNTLDLINYSKEFQFNIEHHIASNGGILVSKTKEKNFIHHQIPLHTKNPLRIINNIFSLRKIIKKFNINLVHARSRAPAWSALWATKICKIPFVTTYHGTYNAHNFLKYLYNSVMTKGNRVIAISNFMKNYIEQKYPQCSKRIITIKEGIDTKRFDPKIHNRNDIENFRNNLKISQSTKILLLVGRLTRWKGQHVLLEACKHLDNKSLDIAVIFIGDDQGRNHYTSELNQISNDIKSHVYFIKAFTPLSLAYSASDIVFSCSTDPEAFGRVTAEALLMKRPFIGTNHGATVELIQHFGKLVIPNDPVVLSQAITQVLRMDVNSLKKTRDGGRKHIESNYNIKNMCIETIQLYESILYENKENTLRY